MQSPAKFLPRCFVALCAGALLSASPDPLDRLEPVPSTEPIPAMDFFRPKLFRSPELNDAGTHFAALLTDKADRTQVFIYDLQTGKSDSLFGPRDSSFFSFDWMGDTHLLLSIGKEKRFAEGTCVAELGSLNSVYYVEKFNVMEILSIPRKNPFKPVVWVRANAWDSARRYSPMILDAKQRIPVMDESLVFELDSAKFPYGVQASICSVFPETKDKFAAGYFCDNDGNLAYSYTESGGKFELNRLVDKTWQTCPVDLDKIDVQAVGEAPDELIVLGPPKTGTPRALFRMDATTGKLGDVLYQDSKYDINTVRFYRHPVTRRILGIQYNRFGPQSVWFDEGYQALQKRIEASFPIPKTVLRILGSDTAEKRFVVAAFSDRMPWTYYQIDLEKKSLGLIKSTAPWIDPKRMRPMAPMSFKNRDGLRLEGYLTLPEGASKENPAPLVVLPHGGPWSRDTWGFDSEVQFLANRGYAVFQPNYRGSLDYDWMFPNKAEWDFRRMHDDVTDGVQALIRTGFVDPRRIAIMGTSFGAYLSLCGVAYEKDLYRCAVALAGVFDWEQVIKEAKREQYETTEYNVLRRHLGDPGKRQELFDSISPLRHIDQVKVPVFVAHGKVDMVANVSQSRRLVNELEKYKVPHEKHFVGGETHGFHYYKNRLMVYTAIEAFLEKHLKNAK